VQPPGLAAPLRTIYCVGRNYAEHAKELGNAVPDEPLVFLKPASSLVLDGGTVRIPDGCSRLDHEAEVVVTVDASRKRLYAVGIDLTARDFQEQAKKKGEPWTRAKGFKGAAAIGAFVDAWPPFKFRLSVNGRLRQTGNTRDMIFSFDRVLSYIDENFGLGPGDVVFTGTPAGVASLASGDVVDASINDVASHVTIRIP
jgi:2-keto-4-pentenoate hydratase/2-oxohepta-3-ene-1,7-dioic acid hydratase in catechol pathway